MLRNLRGLTFGTAIAALLLLSACSDGGSAQPRSPSPAAPAALPPQLQTMLQRVADIRDLPAPAGIKAGFVSRSELPALMDRLLTDDDRKMFANTTTLYRLLGHLRQNQDYQSVYSELTAQAVAGLYSPQDKALWVVHPDGANVDLDNLSHDQASTFAHELTHAVQDGHAGLLAVGKRVEQNLDANLAWTCVVEGDAVSTERLYGAKYLAAIPVGRSAVILADIRTPMTDIPPSLARELLFPYQEGADWISGLRQRQGNQAIDPLLSNPPAAGTSAVLHPDQWAGGLAPAEVPLPSLENALGSGWSHQSGGAFGEFELRNYLQLRLPASMAVTAATGWQGDHYDVYAHGSDNVAVFRIRFADQTEAQQFRDTQDRFLATMTDSQSTTNGITVTKTKDGNATARLSSPRPEEVIFVIGSNSDVALKAARALGGG